ncbi:hypothetical protein HK099_004322 [Clydaea vesicula]|uniref:HYDIN/VesB/CFA65-like Ig-like domain-containing protein n=1 Tax=Clydaea vesicula TaxID=447962 RepID=A0AAD5U9Z4_9FUNG|nr:hypothetical protein HK099_004322 [Clydaea vesicula]
MSHTGSSLVPGSVLRHSMNNIVLECSAGLPEISISPDCVLFGDAYIGESIVKSFTITNAHRLNADITITTTSPEFTFPEVKSISFNSKLEILLTFTPTSCKCYDGMLIVSCDGLTKNIPVSGFGRKVGSINSNLGSFSITRIADVIRMLDTPENNKNRYNGVELKAKSSEGADFAIPPKNVYDFGLIDSSKPKLSLFKVTNSGHFDIYVKNVISSSPVLTWKVLEDATGSELDTIKSSRNLLANCATTSVPENWAGDFMSLDLDKVEVDWDEIDNHLKESGNAKLISRKPSVANQISINQAAARKKKYRASMFGVSSGATASGKEILINSIFPLRIPPFQSAEFLISIMNPITGVFNGSIQILIEKSATEIESHQLTIAANFQPALQLLEKKVSFGVKAVHERHKSELKFTNLANIPLSWVLKHDSLKLVPLSKFSDTFSSIKKNCVRNPFEIFPMEGKLMPGCTQSIDLTFTPNIPQHEVFSYFILKTENFSENTIVLHGIGASSCLVADKYHLDFGVLRLGTFKIFKLKLKNQGILQARYFVECENKQYSIDPEQGMLDGDGSVELTVKYFPRFSGNHKTGEFNLSPLTININGVGSYPELVVLTKIVDFGTALFGTTNVKPIMVENKGAAEAHVMLNCHHKGITLEKGDLVVIPPYSAQSINIVYIPLTVEFLDIKVFLRSSDSRGDYFMVHLKGLVGVPKLTTYPIISDENMDFGVCRTHQTHAKEFKMTNDGNIPLNFTSSLELLQVSQIVRYGFVSAAIERNDVSAVKIEPVEGHLPVGQSVIIKILFSPSSIADYTYKFTLNYDFKKIDVKIKGTGGQAILKVENQLQFLDFGVCRLDRYFKKVMTLSNSGNLGVKYIIRPEPINKDWSVYDEEIRQLSKPQIKVTESEGSDKSELLENAESKEEAFWVAILHANGFDLPQPNASCAAYSKTDLLISFCPISESLKLKIFMEGGYIEDVELRGCAAKPKLSVYDSFNPSREEYSLPIAGYGAFADSGVPSINLGVHSVNSESTYFIHLSNEGPFGCDFLIQPTTVKEFDVYPKRGFIESGVSLPLKIYFRPYSENKYQMPLRICWEGEPIKLNVVGAGGLGKLEVAYLDPKDEIKKGIDFGDVPFNSATEKRWLLYNVGMVTVSVSATVENDEYSISMVGDAFPWQGSETKQIQEQMKRQAWNWYPKIQFQIPPSMCMELGTRFFTNSSVMSPGNISIRSECSEFLIPLRGKGGSVNIGHRGDLSLGDIASNFTYSRKIILTNSGSISTPISLYWFIVGHSAESTGAVVKLVETYSAVDPRGGWARSQVMKEKAKQTEGSEPVAFASSDYWKMIKKMILKDKDIEKTEERSTIKLGTMWDDVLNKIHALLRGSPPTGEFGEKPASSDSLLRGLLSSSRSANALTKKGAVNHSAAFLKRRQMFFHLITNLPVSSQSSVTTKPFIGVEPRSGIIPHNGELTLQVQANLSTEDTFLATLVVKSQIPNVPNYEIPLTATPKAVNIICNDNKILNFFRQPIGETETISRTFTNIGHKDIQFTVVNTNNFLSIFPNKGVLKVGQTVNVDFTFKPINECIQNQDVIFEPDCSQNIRFKMFGAGGHVICSLSKYRRFDFGQCMIGKETVSHLPIVNEGTAVLHLSNFQLIETETFYKGATWPSGRISLHQGQVYNLPIIFNPREESPQDGKLIVSTLTESWEIELVGLGREAVLIVSKVALEFTECLIGNAYEQKLGLKNVGDVNYPISVNLDKEFTDISFFPKSMVIQPFSDGQILITYTPSSATKMNVVLVILSPYSSHKIPILLHAGTASIEFSTNTLDFGMFEKLSKPTLPLRLKNTGTVSTSYSIKDVIKPSMFSISNNKGILGPGKFVDVGVTFIRHEVCDFKESIVVKTDLINKTYSITVVGQCEEAVIHADEITFVSMGICPVLDPTTHILNLKNYGKFPLSFTIKSAYPLKCSPVSGVVAGDDTKPLMITWTPSGAYELRTQITLVSNIGNINITVRGKSNFPELAVRSSQVDYGVCAVGFSYKEVVTLINKGRVPLQFSIVPPREIAFATSKVSAVLAPKQETDVKVSFTPTATGRYTTGLVIECRGINYKEVVLTGIGANMKFDIIPQAIDLGRCSYGLQSSHILLLKNSGDVAILAAFSQKDSESHCTIFCPEAVQVNPRESVRCPYSITVNTVGKFQTHLHVSTRENNYSIPISGTGLKIILSKRSQEILEKENLDILNFSDPLTGWMYLDRDNYIFHKKIRNNLKTDLLLSELFSMLLSIVKSQSNEGVQNNSNADILKQVDHSINNIRNSLCTGTISKSIDCDANDERENGHNGIHVDGLVENSGDILRPIPLEEITHSHEMFSNAATIEEVEAHSDFSDAKITVAEEEAINIHPESELVNNSISDVIKDDVIKNLTEDKNQQDDLKIVENFFNIELISPLPTEDTGSEIRIPTAKLDSRECSAEDMELKEPQPLQVLNNEVKIIAVEEAAIELEEVATLIEKVDGLKNEELELVQVHETKNIQIDTLDNDEKSNHEQLDANNNNFDESKSNSESIEQPNVNEEVLGTEFSNVISNEALEEAQITDTRISSTDDYSEKIKCESASNQTKTDLESKEKILDENECDVFTPEYQQNTYSTQNMFSTNKSTTSVVNDTIGDTIKDDRSHNDGQQVFSELAATNLEDNEKIHEPVEVNFSSTADNSILGGEGCATISENVATTNLQDEIVIQQNSDSDTHENVKSESNETNAESIIGAGGQNLVLQSNIKQIEDSSTENTEHFNNLEYKIEQNVEKITTEEGIPKFTRQELLEKLLEVKETVFELTNTSVLEGQYLNEVQEYYYDILDMIEPRTHVEIEIVLARPPAIDVEKVAKQPQNLPLDMPSKTHYNKWGEFPQFRRNLRNALTVTSFADPYSFPTGVGVNIFRSYQDSEKDKKQH